MLIFTTEIYFAFCKIVLRIGSPSESLLRSAFIIPDSGIIKFGYSSIYSGAIRPLIVPTIIIAEA